MAVLVGVTHNVVRRVQSACSPTPLLTVGMALYDRRDLNNHNQALALYLLRNSCTCHAASQLRSTLNFSRRSNMK